MTPEQKDLQALAKAFDMAVEMVGASFVVGAMIDSQFDSRYKARED